MHLNPFSLPHYQRSFNRYDSILCRKDRKVDEEYLMYKLKKESCNILDKIPQLHPDIVKLIYQFVGKQYIKNYSCLNPEIMNFHLQYLSKSNPEEFAKLPENIHLHPNPLEGIKNYKVGNYGVFIPEHIYDKLPDHIIKYIELQKKKKGNCLQD